MTQEDLFEGLARKESGQDRVEMNNREFVEEMRRVAVRIAKHCGRVSTDELRNYAHQQGIAPKHQNAWGTVFRGRGWVCLGRTRSRFTTNNGREIKVWGLTGGERG